MFILRLKIISIYTIKEENKTIQILHQRFNYQKSISEVARMFGTSRIQIRKIEAEYINQLKENKNV